MAESKKASGVWPLHANTDAVPASTSAAAAWSCDKHHAASQPFPERQTRFTRHMIQRGSAKMTYKVTQIGSYMNMCRCIDMTVAPCRSSASENTQSLYCTTRSPLVCQGSGRPQYLSGVGRVGTPADLSAEGLDGLDQHGRLRRHRQRTRHTHT
jgi:hypothetical protein